jgi:hypothetical protein
MKRYQIFIIFYPILTKFWASRQIFLQGPNMSPSSGSSTNNTRIDRRTDMRQATGAFRCYAKAGKTVDESGSASALWRLEILDRSLDRYLQTTWIE